MQAETCGEKMYTETELNEILSKKRMIVAGGLKKHIMKIQGINSNM